MDRLVFPLTLGTNVSIAAIRDCTPTIVPRVANLGAVSALRLAHREVLPALMPWYVLSLDRRS